MSAPDITPMQQAVTEHLQQSLEAMRSDLRWLVELESPSDDPMALANAARQMRQWAEERTGANTELVEDELGPHLVGRLTSASEGYLLLVGHLDTVWPLGTLGTHPYAEQDGVATGPGSST